MEIRSCRDAWLHMTDISAGHAVRNYVQWLDMQDYLVEEQKQYFSDLRGGGQGDYRAGMRAKIANVVDCLTLFPQSKRAVIAMCNESMPKHKVDDDAKCLREVYFHLDGDNKLNATVIFRSQAAMLFPKNIHFIGSMMSEVAERHPQRPSLGVVFYLAVILVSDRE